MELRRLGIADRPHAAMPAAMRALRGGRGLHPLLPFDGRWAGSQERAMRLADHGVAADAAQLFGDGAGGMSLPPQGLQHLDAFRRPDHIHCGPLNMLWATHYAHTTEARQEQNRGGCPRAIESP